MRRLAISAALIAGVAVIARAFAPKLHERLLTRCERMFEQMPEDFPPKRMMQGIEETRANTARTLALLEEPKQAAAESEPPGEVSPPEAVGHRGGAK